MKYKIAGVVFEVFTRYGYTEKLCSGYEYSGEEEPKFSLTVSDEDILREREIGKDLTFGDAFFENNAVFRKLLSYLLDRGEGIVFHSSAIAYKDKAYLFTAPSGTGKSTHTAMWRKILGDKVFMVNDDKPIVKYENGDFYVCGTPWNGKHKLDTNTKVKISAICLIHQAKDNEIKEVGANEMIGPILNQTVRPMTENEMDKLLDFIGKLVSKVKLYKMGCNMDLSAGKTSIEKMTGEKINED